MNQLYHHYERLYQNIINGDKKAADELVSCMMCGYFNQTAYSELTLAIRKFERNLKADNPNLVFLQAVLSIFQNGAVNPVTLNLAKIARSLGHERGSALLAFVISSNNNIDKFYSPLHTRDTKKTIRKLCNFKTITPNDLVIESFWQKAINQGSSAAMLASAIRTFSKTRDSNSNSRVLNDEKTKLIECWTLLNSAIEDNNLYARLRRPDLYLDFIEINNENYIIDFNYNIQNAINDLDWLVIEVGDTFAIRTRALLAYSNALCYKDLTKDYELANRLLRKAYLDKDSDTKEIKKSTAEKISALSQLNKKGDMDLRVDYHMIMAFHQHRYSLFWRYKVQKLYQKLTVLDNRRLQNLMETIIVDDLISADQKTILLSDFLNFYSKKIMKSKTDRSLIDYQTFLKGCDALLGLAEQQKTYNLVVSLYKQIPIETAAGIEAQIRLADAYYNSAIAQGYDVISALVAVKPHHDVITQAYEKLLTNKTIDYCLQQRYEFYQLIIKDRENNAKILYDNRLQNLMETIIVNNSINTDQKIILLSDLLNSYSKIIMNIKTDRSLIDYQMFLKGCNALLGLAEQQKTYDLVVSLYKQIPIETSTGIEAQIRLADAYYNSAIAQGYDVISALAVVKPYHDVIIQAYEKALANNSVDHCLQQPYEVYQLIINGRENYEKNLNENEDQKANSYLRALQTLNRCKESAESEKHNKSETTVFKIEPCHTSLFKATVEQKEICSKQFVNKFNQEFSWLTNENRGSHQIKKTPDEDKNEDVNELEEIRKKPKSERLSDFRLVDLCNKFFKTLGNHFISNKPSKLNPSSKLAEGHCIKSTNSK